jgi:hypothetical protein
LDRDSWAQRWLPGTSCVAPFFAVKSVNAHIVGISIGGHG